MLDHQPDATNLLETALVAFRRDILPSLDGERRFTGLMIANALSIALREISRDSRMEDDLAIGLSILLGPAGTDLPTRLAELAHTITEGRLDGEPAALRTTLMALTRARLRVANPKMLQSGT